MLRKRFQTTVLFAGAASLLLLFTASESLADRNVNANEAIIISDDIRNETTDVVSVSGVPFAGGGNGDNNSGLGDGTNPGQGDGTGNSPNQGTDNPNNAGGGDGTADSGNGPSDNQSGLGDDTNPGGPARRSAKIAAASFLPSEPSQRP